MSVWGDQRKRRVSQCWHLVWQAGERVPGKLVGAQGSCERREGLTSNVSGPWGIAGLCRSWENVFGDGPGKAAGFGVVEEEVRQGNPCP